MDVTPDPPAATKPCPRCAEQIKAQAVVCRFCGFEYASLAGGNMVQGRSRQAKTNGMAIASLVLGILWLYWIGSALALIFGYMGRKQIDESGGAEAGRGLAVAGIVLGWVGVGFLALLLLLAMIGAAA